MAIIKSAKKSKNCFQFVSINFQFAANVQNRDGTTPECFATMVTQPQNLDYSTD